MVSEARLFLRSGVVVTFDTDLDVSAVESKLGEYLADMNTRSEKDGVCLLAEPTDRIDLVAKPDLTPAQLAHVTERLDVAAQRNESTQRGVWGTYPPEQFFIPILRETLEPIGVLFASFPNGAVDASWWIDSPYRGKSYGNEAVRLLAKILRDRGYTKVATITVNSSEAGHHQASRKLVDLFRYLMER
jgi:RimJ/RimL family protein N-acetyltransferase